MQKAAAGTRAGKQTMTEGPLGKQILFFSLPLMMAQILEVLFNLSDVAVVGKFSSYLALGAVGSTTLLVSLFTGFLIGMGSGVNVRVAYALGAGNDEEVRRSVHSALLLCLMAGILICLVCNACAVPMLTLLGTKEELIDGAVRYFRIYSLGMPAMALYNFGNGVMSACGETRKPLVYLTIAGLLNVVLNLFFVIACRMAEAGVALASAISQCVSAVLILRHLLRRTDRCRVRVSEIRLYRESCKGILLLGIPAGFQNAIFAIANLFVQSGVNTFDAVVVSGNAAATNADSLIYNVMGAFYTACSSFISQNWGAGKTRRMRQSYWIALGYSFLAGALLGGMLLLFGRKFLALFTNEPAVVEAGMMRLRIMGFSYCVSAFMDCTIAASRGMGKSVWPTVLVIMGSCVFRVIWVYTVFAYFRTIASLYFLYVFSWTITAAAEIVYFWRSYRRLVGTKPT